MKNSQKNIKTTELINKYKRYISDGHAFKYFPMVISKANGAKIWDINGREYIDFLSSAATFNTGHNNPQIINAITKNLDKYLHYCFYIYHEPAIKLAEILTHITPGNFAKKVAFGLSGSDAVDTAVKASLIYTRKRNIASFTYSYHGTTFMGISISGSFKPELRYNMNAYPYVYFFEFPDTYRRPNNMSEEEYGEFCLEKIEKFFEMVVPGSTFAALVFEPIQGDGGVLVPPINFVRGLYRLVRSYGICFVDDEVQTGIGRTGKMLAIEHFGVDPDLVVLGKALGGGMPISATVGKREILDSAPPQTFFMALSPHAISSIAAITTLRFIKTNNLLSMVREKGEYMMRRLQELKEKYEIIGDVRGLGLMLGIEIIKDEIKKKPDKKKAVKIIWRAWENGLLMATYGKYGNVLRIAPPLVIEKEEIDKAIEILDISIKDVLTGKVSDKIFDLMKPWD
ncbi:MAG: aspartate aminotransferase family protein [Candidatus Aenigmatarchaeota archaeon]